MRRNMALNGGWRYRADFRDEYLDPSYSIGSWDEVDLPHANKELPFNGFDESCYQFVSAYALDIDIPLAYWGGAQEAGRRLFLDFEGVMTACEIWVDGKAAGGHKGGYTPFSVEIGGFAKPGAPNRILVRVDSTERADIPPFGHVIDYLCYGGIYREASLRSQGESWIADLFAWPERALEDRKTLCVRVETAGETSGLELGLALRECGAGPKAAVLGELRAPLEPGPDGAARLDLEGLAGLRLWELEDPALYLLEATLYRGGEAVDFLSRRVGFRTAQWKPGGFYLNGRRKKLVGLNRHQSWPYVGYAMPARVQRRDAEILKRELCLDIVRTSHYPQSVHFLDRCDELGLLVLEELPGWQHIGDAAWKDAACLALEEMIRRDRSRPSIVLWGLRINESRDDHDFYARTNEIAHRLDPGRSRGGIRNLEKSELLEDVYTFNDFVHSGGKKALRKPKKVTGLARQVPYIVTEHNGHMYPTKRFDQEERLAEHALRHLRVLDAAFGDPGISGAIGWCAFDYNTHKDFGSGDRICYHGVSDMFRVPKYAAAVYASQVDAAKRPVLDAASLFAKGERSAAKLLPVEIYTNCDAVVLYRSGELVGTYYPAREEYPNIPHPPVVIRDLIGDRLKGSIFSGKDQALIRKLVARVFIDGFGRLGWLELLRFGLLLRRYRMSVAEAEALAYKYTVGWGQEDESFELVGLVGGKEVVRRRYGGDARADRLAMEADDLVLSASGPTWDATRIVLRLLDQYGNVHPFATEVVDLEVEGPASLIGPSRLPLVGGACAFWLRTAGRPGTAILRARGLRFDAGGLEIRIT